MDRLMVERPLLRMKLRWQALIIRVISLTTEGYDFGYKSTF
jgi:hypothetical protein